LMTLQKHFKALFVITALTVSPLLACAAEGGSNGGGGNIRGGKEANREDIASTLGIVRMASIPLIERFFDFEEEYNREVIARLGPKNLVQRALNANENVRLLIADKCRNLQPGRDASADQSKNEVCFSVDDILKRKLSRTDIGASLTSLYLHELAHILGLGGDAKSEAVAEKFQTGIEDLLPLGFKPSDVIHSQELALEELGGMHVTLYESNKSNLIAGCRTFQQAISRRSIERFVDSHVGDSGEYQTFDSVLSYKHRAKIRLIYAYLLIGDAVCAGPDSVEIKNLSSIFRGRDSITARELLEGRDIRWLGRSPIFDRVVNAPQPGNIDQLVAVVEQINELIMEMTNEFFELKMRRFALGTEDLPVWSPFHRDTNEPKRAK
ncbi:MAG TPA: hypothetical protein VM432_04345, partial [Bdellovibrionales bacterium]|nr:hypothetical protein [Bdellovibrionales bacterium]